MLLFYRRGQAENRLTFWFEITNSLPRFAYNFMIFFHLNLFSGSLLVRLLLRNWATTNIKAIARIKSARYIGKGITKLFG